MQLLNFTSPRSPLPSHCALSISQDKYLAVMHGQDLWLCELSQPDEPHFTIKNVVEHSFQQNHLATIGVDGHVQVFELRDGRMHNIARFKPEGMRGHKPSELLRVYLSHSGNYMVIEWKTDVAKEANVEAGLYATRTGDCVYSTPLHYGASRAAFAELPTGEEVLFLSAVSYMGIQMIDCATGAVRKEYVPGSDIDFCHTDYILTDNALRLLTFGCVWAAPYEVRVYDFASWFGDAESEHQNFPLPLIFRQPEVFDGLDTVLPPSKHSVQGETYICLSLITGTPSNDSTTEVEQLMSELSAVDRDIYQELLLRQYKNALLARHVNLRDGNIEKWTLAEIDTTNETHIHLLDNFKAICINERVQIVDLQTGETSDMGPSSAPEHWFQSSASSDAQTVALFAVEQN